MKKKNARKKPTAVKRLARPQPGVMAIVPLSEIVKPEMYRGKMTLTPTPFNQNQIARMVSPVPPKYIKSRPGKGGGQWDYVPAWWFRKQANFTFGFSHSFEILGERVDGDFITVKGKLTIKDQKTGRELVSKVDYGGAEIKRLKATGKPLDIGNDFKAASSDAFKRCMVQFGFAGNVYGKAENIEGGMPVREDDPEPPRPAPAGRATKTETILIEAECHECANPITNAEAEYSKKLYGKPLCRTCQKLKKEGKI